jgi:hypothetical protein
MLREILRYCQKVNYLFRILEAFMNKFLLMIFSVSIFFIGVGGIAKQISAQLNSGKQHLVMVPRIEPRIDKLEKINSLESFTLVDKSNKPVLREGDQIEKSGEDFQIELQAPLQPNKVIELRRQPFSESLIQRAEQPPINEKDTIIYLDKNHTQINPAEPNQKEIPEIRVFIDKENKRR